MSRRLCVCHGCFRSCCFTSSCTSQTWLELRAFHVFAVVDRFVCHMSCQSHNLLRCGAAVDPGPPDFAIVSMHQVDHPPYVFMRRTVDSSIHASTGRCLIGRGLDRPTRDNSGADHLLVITRRRVDAPSIRTATDRCGGGASTGRRPQRRN